MLLLHVRGGSNTQGSDMCYKYKIIKGVPGLFSFFLFFFCLWVYLCVSMCVCMCVYMYVCMCVCVCVCMYV